MAVYERKGWWYADFYIGTRRVRQKAGATRRDAERVLKALQADALRGKYDMIAGMKAPRFGEYAEEIAKWSKREKRSWVRDATSLRHLCGFFGTRRLSEIGMLDIEGYKVERLSAGMCRSTIDRELAILRVLFNHAVREGKIKRNPLTSDLLFHEDNKVEHPLSADDERKLLAASPPWLRDFIIFALSTGLRKAQIEGLKWTQLEKRPGTIYLPAAVCKSKRDHTLPLNATAQAVIAAQERRGECVFGGDRPLSGVHVAFKKALAAAGLDRGFRIHDLRHSCASRLAERGCDVATLQQLMQHADLKTTQRYIHPSAQAMERSVRLLDSHQSVTIPFSEVADQKVAVAASSGAPVTSEARIGGYEPPLNLHLNCLSVDQTVPKISVHSRYL